MYCKSSCYIWNTYIIQYCMFSSDQDRVVLIVDILRPSWIPLGTAEGGHTEELDQFIDMFR